MLYNILPVYYKQARAFRLEIYDPHLCIIFTGFLCVLLAYVLIATTAVSMLRLHQISLEYSLGN